MINETSVLTLDVPLWVCAVVVVAAGLAAALTAFVMVFLFYKLRELKLSIWEKEVALPSALAGDKD